MKKLTALLLALVMALSLTACSFVMLPEEQGPPADPKQEQQLAWRIHTPQKRMWRCISTCMAACRTISSQKKRGPAAGLDRRLPGALCPGLLHRRQPVRQL